MVVHLLEVISSNQLTALLRSKFRFLTMVWKTSTPLVRSKYSKIYMATVMTEIVIQLKKICIINNIIGVHKLIFYLKIEFIHIIFEN